MTTNKKKVSKKTTRKKQPTTVASKAIKLDSELRIKNVLALKDDINKIKQTTGLVTVDASHVEKIDTAIMQLLASYSLKLAANQQHIDWQAPSDTFIQAAKLLGLSEHLGLSNAN